MRTFWLVALCLSTAWACTGSPWKGDEAGFERLADVLGEQGGRVIRPSASYWTSPQPEGVCRVMVLHPFALPPFDRDPSHTAPVVHVLTRHDALQPFTVEDTQEPPVIVCTDPASCTIPPPLGLPAQAIDPDQLAPDRMPESATYPLSLSSGEPILAELVFFDGTRRMVLADRSLLSNLSMSFAVNRSFAAALLGCEGKIAVLEHALGGVNDFSTDPNEDGGPGGSMLPGIRASLLPLVVAWLLAAAMLGFRVVSPQQPSRTQRRHMVEHALALAGRLALHRKQQPTWADERVRRYCLERLRLQAGARDEAAIVAIARRTGITRATLVEAVETRDRTPQELRQHNRVLLETVERMGDLP
jgi:hypothetical protein